MVTLRKRNNNGTAVVLRTNHLHNMTLRSDVKSTLSGTKSVDLPIKKAANQKHKISSGKKGTTVAKKKYKEPVAKASTKTTIKKAANQKHNISSRKKATTDAKKKYKEPVAKASTKKTTVPTRALAFMPRAARVHFRSKGYPRRLEDLLLKGKYSDFVALCQDKSYVSHVDLMAVNAGTCV